MSSLADHFLSMASSQFYKQTGMESQTLKIQLPTAGHGRYAAMQLCSFNILYLVKGIQHIVSLVLD